MLQLEHERFHLRDLLTEVSAVYSEQARGKLIGWALRLAPDLPLYLQGDEGWLRQVLGNLLSNALKFTQRGGRVEIAISSVVPNASNARCWPVRMKGSGVDISAKQQATLFEPFTQADTSTARRYGGSGLSMAICARLVWLIRGSISVEMRWARAAALPFCCRSMSRRWLCPSVRHKSWVSWRPLASALQVCVCWWRKTIR